MATLPLSSTQLFFLRLLTDPAQIARYLLPGTEPDNLFPAPLSNVDVPDKAVMVLFEKVADLRKIIPVELILTPSGQIGTRRCSKVSYDHSHDAQKERHIQKNDRVSLVDPATQRVMIAAVHDPGRLLHKLPLNRYLPFSGYFLPAGPPEQTVEVDDLNLEYFSQLAGKGRFTRT